MNPLTDVSDWNTARITTKNNWTIKGEVDDVYYEGDSKTIQHLRVWADEVNGNWSPPEETHTSIVLAHVSCSDRDDQPAKGYLYWTDDDWQEFTEGQEICGTYEVI
ncbi:hypothetical protein ACLI4Z_09240 [Natrialbaceae archaeon A-arb3/5]